MSLRNRALRRDARLDKEQYHLVLLAKNENGYKNLIKLVSRAFSEGFYYKPRVDKELLARVQRRFDRAHRLPRRRSPHRSCSKATSSAPRSRWASISTSSARTTSTSSCRRTARRSSSPSTRRSDTLSRQTGLKLVATNDIHYLNAKDAEAHDILLCIQTGSTLDDPNRFRFGTQEFYFKTPDQMARLFCEHARGAREHRSKSPTAATSSSTSAGLCFPIPACPRA